MVLSHAFNGPAAKSKKQPMPSVLDLVHGRAKLLAGSMS